MENKCVIELIEEALSEADIMEKALDDYNVDHMLFVTQKLSGAPFSFIEDVYNQQAA